MKEYRDLISYERENISLIIIGIISNYRYYCPYHYYPYWLISYVYHIPNWDTLKKDSCDGEFR